MTTANGVIAHPDGRVELTPAARAQIEESSLSNDDLAPVPLERRTWTTYSYMALWIGMSVNIPSWLLAVGLIGIGMDWLQALITIALGNLIVLVPMLLNSHAGTKYGIPFPVFTRASFGTIGANIAALLRAGVACGWFGIQTWIGGGAIFVLVGTILGQGSFWTDAGVVFGQPWTLWLSFAVFWLLNVYIILKGMNTLRIFERGSKFKPELGIPIREETPGRPILTRLSVRGFGTENRTERSADDGRLPRDRPACAGTDPARAAKARRHLLDRGPRPRDR